MCLTTVLIETESAVLLMMQYFVYDVDTITGIACYWLEVLKNSPITADLISEADERILRYLIDIKCSYSKKISSPVSFMFLFGVAKLSRFIDFACDVTKRLSSIEPNYFQIDDLENQRN